MFHNYSMAFYSIYHIKISLQLLLADTMTE